MYSIWTLETVRGCVSFKKCKSQGKAVEVTVNSREENSYVFCLDFVQEFGLFDARGWQASREFYLTRTLQSAYSTWCTLPPPLHSTYFCSVLNLRNYSLKYEENIPAQFTLSIASLSFSFVICFSPFLLSFAVLICFFNLSLSLWFYYLLLSFALLICFFHLSLSSCLFASIICIYYLLL